MLLFYNAEQMYGISNVTYFISEKAFSHPNFKQRGKVTQVVSDNQTVT